MKLLATKTALFLSVIGLLFMLNSATIIKENRMVEGKIFNKITNEPLSINIEIYRDGQSWVIKSNKEGWYSVSLPIDRAYAVKIHQLDGYKNYTEAFFLDQTEDTYIFDIFLAPKEDIENEK